MTFAVVIPTYNERENVPLLIEKLSRALHGLDWEAIFVDDDSPDGTAEVVAEHARLDPRIRLLQRIGRRGLASACIEGMLATQAPFLAVMDGDLQHDECVLPRMFEMLRMNSLDVVVATRHADGGSMGDFQRMRVLLSRLGQNVSTMICKTKLTDPMSGFFALRREFLLDVAHDLQGGGFKILIDLLSSARRPVRVAEVGFRFGQRQHGQSKLDLVVGLEYLAMVLNKLCGGVLSVQLTLYLLVGALGLFTCFALSFLLIHTLHLPFLQAQSISTVAVMGENFLLNNRYIFRDRRLRGTRLISGGINFLLICSFGAWANLVLTSSLLREGVQWSVAGLCGIVLGSVWNLSISSQFTWRVRRRPEIAEAESYALLENLR